MTLIPGTVNRLMTFITRRRSFVTPEPISWLRLQLFLGAALRRRRAPEELSIIALDARNMVLFVKSVWVPCTWNQGQKACGPGWFNFDPYPNWRNPKRGGGPFSCSVRPRQTEYPLNNIGTRSHIARRTRLSATGFEVKALQKALCLQHGLCRRPLSDENKSVLERKGHKKVALHFANTR